MANNTTLSQEEQQKQMEAQKQYAIQMQKMYQKQMYAQQIMQALGQVSSFNVLKTAGCYGIRFNIDFNTRNIISQKLYQAFVVDNKSESEEEWTTLTNALMSAYQQTMQQMLFQNQMGAQIPGANPMMGGMGMMPNMAAPTQQTSADGKDAPSKVANMKSYFAQQIFSVDPIIFMSILMNSGVDFDDSSLEQLLSQALCTSVYAMDDNTLMYFYTLVISIYSQNLQKGKDGNAAPNQNPMMNPMMGGFNPMMMGGMMPNMGMGMGMPGAMPNPMMGGMPGMGMGMPMMGNGFTGMPGMQQQMPGMNNVGNGVRALY